MEIIRNISKDVTIRSDFAEIFTKLKLVKYAIVVGNWSMKLLNIIAMNTEQQLD